MSCVWCLLGVCCCTDPAPLQRALRAGITSGVLASRSINAPATQSLLNYALLAAVCGALHVRAEGWRLRNKWWTYLVLAALDVQGNFLVTKVS